MKIRGRVSKVEEFILRHIHRTIYVHCIEARLLKSIVLKIEARLLLLKDFELRVSIISKIQVGNGQQK